MSVASSSAICSSSITVTVAGASAICSGMRVAVTTICSSFSAAASSAASAAAGVQAAASAARADPVFQPALRFLTGAPKMRVAGSSVDLIISPVVSVGMRRADIENHSHSQDGK